MEEWKANVPITITTFTQTMVDNGSWFFADIALGVREGGGQSFKATLSHHVYFSDTYASNY
jgi:hypothetical protein